MEGDCLLRIKKGCTTTTTSSLKLPLPVHSCVSCSWGCHFTATDRHNMDGMEEDLWRIAQVHKIEDDPMKKSSTKMKIWQLCGSSTKLYYWLKTRPFVLAVHTRAAYSFNGKTCVPLTLKKI